MIVALNRFSKDTQAEIDLVLRIAKENGAFDAVLCEHWSYGGKGAEQLARAVVEATNTERELKFLYDLGLPIEEKIRIIATEIYRAKDIELSEEVQKRIELYKKQVMNL